MMAEDPRLADSFLIAVTEIWLLLPDQVPLIRTAEFFCAAPHQLRQFYLAQVHPATACHPVTLLGTANDYFDDCHQLQAAICGYVPSYLERASQGARLRARLSGLPRRALDHVARRQLALTRRRRVPSG